MNKLAIGNPNFAKWAKATATTVYLMTAVKATVRPAFNLADKKSDEKSRKYSAVNEFLYQAVCIGFAAGMIPFAERYGLKLAEKQLSKIAELKNANITKLSELDEFKNLADLKGFKKLKAFKKMYLDKSFDENFVSKVKAAKGKTDINRTEADKNILKADKAMHLAYGGVETGSFLASIVGLTLLAPMLSHKILHPIMTAMGMTKKEPDIGKPSETFLADAKVPTDKTSTIKLNA